jgi:hypothetical protein
MLLPTSMRQGFRVLWPHHRVLLVGLWLLVQAAFLVRYHGPHYANDSELYLAYSTNVAKNGYYKFEPIVVVPGQAPVAPDTFVLEHTQRYVLYTWFQIVWLWLKTGWWGIVLGQIMVSGLAACALYNGVRRLASGQCAAALATLLFISWPDIQQFNCYLLTESLFISMSVLSFAAYVRVRTGGWRAWVVFLLTLLLTALTRPNGFVLTLAALTAGLENLRQRPSKRLFWAAVGAIVVAIPLALVVLNQRLQSYFIVETYQRGELIYGSSVWAVHSATPLMMPSDGIGQVPRILYFAAHNPGFLLRLMFGKLFVFVSGMKPYYSVAHRIVYVLVLWPLYVLAVRGTQRQDVWKLGRVFLAAVPLWQAAVIMLTVEDWDVRFLAPVLPFVFILAALAISEWIKKWRSEQVNG